MLTDSLFWSLRQEEEKSVIFASNASKGNRTQEREKRKKRKIRRFSLKRTKIAGLEVLKKGLNRYFRVLRRFFGYLALGYRKSLREDLVKGNGFSM